VRTVIDQCLALRDRLLSSPKFQGRAASLPLTRFIARRRANDLFNLCAGFVYSQVLAACVELRLFDLLLEEPLDVSALSQRLRLPVDGCRRLANAAVALRLLQKRRDDRYGLGPLGAALARNPGLAAMIAHHRHLYADLSDPVALLRRSGGATALGKYWPYADSRRPTELSSDQVAEYSALMALSQPMVADEVLEVYPLDAHRCLLDVGGGEGAFLVEAAKRFPRLRLMLFDLPAVAERARIRLRDRGFAERSTIFSGDFFADPLPKGADVISLIRVVLDHDDQKALALLASARKALSDGGVLLLAEPSSQSGGYEPMASAYFGFYLMAMGHGRVRTQNEVSNLLERTGFRSVEFRKGRRILQTGIVVAKV
jgi:demethylspheroidene O-methyltransferase